MRRFLGPSAVLFAAVLWSLDGLLRQSLYAAPSFLVVTLEHALGTLLFAPLLLRSHVSIRALSAKTWGALAWVSLFGGILGTFLYTKALASVGYIDLSVVVLLQKLQPFFAIALAAAVLHERLHKRFFLLAGGALIGGYCITFPDLLPTMQTDAKHAGAALLAVGAAFCWGTSTVFGKQALASLPFSAATGLRLLITTVLALLPLLWLGQWSAAADLNGMQWSALLLIVLSTGSVALSIYYFGLKRIPASHATLYELAWPLSAVIIDAVVRGTILSPTQYLGAALLLLCLVLLSRRDAAHFEMKNA